MHPLALTFDEFSCEARRCCGKGATHAAAAYRAILGTGARCLSTASAWAGAQEARGRLERELQWPACRIAERHEEEGVVKIVSELGDGHRIESVLIPARGRTTLCISSQVGCRWACRFCATGRMGFVRDLTAEEIVWQVWAARFDMRCRVDNIVFMGMGEPLDNVANVVQAIRVLSDQRGLDIAPRHMTLSTAGHVDGLGALAAANVPGLRLAVSVNAARDGLRSELMPINRRYPLARLKEALSRFPLAKRGVIFVEYVLLAGVNDTHDDARQLARLLEGLAVRVNLIPYNGHGAGDYVPPEDARVRRFHDWLDEARLFTRTRLSRGRGVLAACGQLGSRLPFRGRSS